MEILESTIESPLRFIISFLKFDGEGYLHKQFVYPEDLGTHYIADREVIRVQEILPWGMTRGELVDEETNFYIYELTFPEFVKEEFERQFDISKNLINQISKKNGDDQDLKLYKLVLLFCLDVQKSIDSVPDLKYKDDLNRFISRLLSFVYKKFERLHPKTALIKSVFKYYKNRKDSNVTGFKLIAQVRNAPLREIIDHLIKNEFVAKKTNKDSIKEFFNGNIPKPKIDWKKELSELKFFIDQIYSDKILEYQKGQQWHLLDQVFTHNGEKLPENWQRNHNKLKNKQKREAIEAIKTMLSPKINSQIIFFFENADLFPLNPVESGFPDSPRFKHSSLLNAD